MLEKTAHKIFGGVAKRYADYFESLETSLKKSGMKTPIEEYFSLMLFCSILSFIIVMLLGSFFLTLILMDIGYAYTLSIIAGFVALGSVFLFGYYYPSIKTKDLQSKTDKSLPFAVFYMATSASSGVSPVEIFKILSLRKGVIAREAKKIYTDVKTMGMSIGDALQRAATSTPSKDFADLLWGLSSIITRGGDIEKYLSSETNVFMNKYRRTLNDYSKTVSLYSEIYITLIIVGSLLFTVLISIMAPMGGGGVLFIQTLIVFCVIPMVSIGFLFLIKSISPFEY